MARATSAGVDGDAPAAMRYTEARITPIGFELLTDIDKDTVDFVDNFDGSLQETRRLARRDSEPAG